MGNNDYFSKKLRRVVDAKGVYHPSTHGGPHFILGTGKPLGEISTPMTHEQVLDRLHQMGEWAESTSGTYGDGLEPTIIIKHPKNIDALHKLASDLGQESAILSDGGMHEMHYYHGPNKGKIRLGQGTNVYTSKPKDNYTTLMDRNGNNRFFSHNFDFDDKNLVPMEAKLKKDEDDTVPSIEKLKTPSTVKFGMSDSHARKIRDAAESAGGIIHKRDLEKQNLSVKKAGIPHLVNEEGYVNADSIKNHIKANQQLVYNTSHGTFDQVVPSDFLPDEENRKQRHNDELSNVFRLDATPWHINQMKDAGVYENFKKMNEISQRSGHPVGPNTIGWVRYTHGPDGNIHIDEVQSDYGQSLEDFAHKQGREMKILGNYDDSDIENMIRNVQRTFPDTQMERVNQILLGDSHPSDLVHEAFMQRLRDSGFTGNKISLMGYKTKAELAGMKPEPTLPKSQGRKSWSELSESEQSHLVNQMMESEDTPDAYRNKDNIIDWAKRHHFVYNKKDGNITGDYFLPYPVHIRRTHSQFPSKKWGYNRGSYGEIATQNNPKHQGKDVWTKTLRKSKYYENTETKHVNVKFDTNKAREIRDLAEQAGGTIHKKDLEKQGINLKSAGVHHLIQGNGHISANDVQDHIDSLPSVPFHVSDSWYGANNWDSDYEDIPHDIMETAQEQAEEEFSIEDYIEHNYSDAYDLPSSYYSKKHQEFVDSHNWEMPNPHYDPEGSDFPEANTKTIDVKDEPNVHDDYEGRLEDFHNDLMETAHKDPYLHDILYDEYSHELEPRQIDIAREIMEEEGPSGDYLDRTAEQEQRHNAEMSQVMKLHVAPETLNKIKKEGLEDLYDELDDHAIEGHPTEHGGIGWVRFTQDPSDHGIHIDEIQSDRGSGLIATMKDKAANLKYLQNTASRDEDGVINSTADEHEIMENEEDLSKMKRLYEILFGGKTHSQALHETFHQYMRDTSYKYGDPVHIWQVNPKAVISGQQIPPKLPSDQKFVEWSGLSPASKEKVKQFVRDWSYDDHNVSALRNSISKVLYAVDKKTGDIITRRNPDRKRIDPFWVRPIPVHMRNTYHNEPKNMGYKSSQYGELKTQNNIDHYTKDTWKTIIRKIEELTELYPLQKDDDEETFSLNPSIRAGDTTYHPDEFNKPLGVKAPVSVKQDTNPARMIRDLAEENGGVIHKKYLEKQGHNLKTAGIAHLVDAKGQVKASDIHNHINSLPSRLYLTSHTEYGGGGEDYSDEQLDRIRDMARDMAQENNPLEDYIREKGCVFDLPNYDDDYHACMQDFNWVHDNPNHDPEDEDSEKEIDYYNNYENVDPSEHPDFEEREAEALDYVIDKFVRGHNYGHFSYSNNQYSKIMDDYESHIDEETDRNWDYAHENFDEVPEEDVPDNEQRHKEGPSDVFQLNLAPHHYSQMEEAGVLMTYGRLANESRFDSHPAGEDTIGWVRYTGDDEKGIHIDEIQSDFDSGLRKKLKLVSMTPFEEDQYIKQSNSSEGRKERANLLKEQKIRYPKEDLLKIKEILYGGQHETATKIIHEAFLQRMRDAGMAGTPVHIWDLNPKQKLSGQQSEPELDKKNEIAKPFHQLTRPQKNRVIKKIKERIKLLKRSYEDKDKPVTLEEVMKVINQDMANHLFIINKGTGEYINSFRPAPVHMRQNYSKDPKKMGYKPAKYGELETQTGDHDDESTWAHVLRKLEELAGIIPLEKDAKVLQFPNMPKEKVLEEHKKRKDKKEKSIELANKFLQGSGHEDSHADKLGRLFFRFPQHRLAIMKKLKELQQTNNHVGFLETPEGKIAIPNYHAKPTGTMGSKPDSFWNDVFSWTDINHKAGKKLLTEHLKINKPVDIHTSSDLIAHDDYANLIPNGSTINFHAQDHDKSRGFPSNNRLKGAGEKLKNLGHKVNYIGFNGEPNLTVLKREYMHRKFILNGSLTHAGDSNYNLNKTQKVAGDAILRAMGKINDPITDIFWSFLTKSVDIRTEGRVFVSMDGDNIGASVERAAMSDDLDTIVSQSELIFSGQSMIREWARKFNADVYIDGGDDMAFTLPKQHLFALKDLKSSYNKTTGFTVTIGVGDTISHAGHAMLYGKLHGKDQINIWSPELDAELEAISKELTPHEKIAGHGLLGKNEDEIRLIHYGKQSGLNMIDPKNMGEGLGRKGNESRYGRPEVERSYYYREGSAPESIVAENANARYTATLGPEHRLYDIGTDPDKIHEKLKQSSQSRQVNPGIVTTDQYLKAVKDAGYHGFHNSMSALPEVVALFHAHPVKEDETFRKGEKDDNGNVISIFRNKKKDFKPKVSSAASQAHSLGKEKPVKKLPPSVHRDIELKNHARRLANLSPMKVSINKCKHCGGNFETIDSKKDHCGCSLNKAEKPKHYQEYEDIVGGVPVRVRVFKPNTKGTKERKFSQGEEVHGHHQVPVAENLDWHLRNLWNGAWKVIEDIPADEHRSIHRYDLSDKMKAKKAKEDYFNARRAKFNREVGNKKPSKPTSVKLNRNSVAYDFKKNEGNYTISHVKTGTPQTFILEAHDNKGQKVARAYCINKEKTLGIHNFEVHPNHQHKAKAIAEGFVSHAKKITGAPK